MLRTYGSKNISVGEVPGWFNVKRRENTVSLLRRVTAEILCEVKAFCWQNKLSQNDIAEKGKAKHSPFLTVAKLLSSFPGFLLPVGLIYLYSFTWTSSPFPRYRDHRGKAWCQVGRTQSSIVLRWGWGRERREKYKVRGLRSIIRMISGSKHEEGGERTGCIIWWIIC